MNAFATITSQGQLTIPVKLREQVGLKKPGKVFLDVQDNNIVIKPVSNILSLEGIFHSKAKKNIPIDDVIAEEELAWDLAVKKKYGVNTVSNNTR